MTNKATKRASRVPDAEKLEHDSGYRQLLELDFNDMIPFVRSNIRRKSFISIFYAGVNLGLLTLILLNIIFEMTGPGLTLLKIIKQSIIGVFAGSILIIPLHEFLHGIAYRIVGARKIRYGIDLKQFIFFVTADRHTVSGKELQFLAMTPFVVINAVTITIFFAWFPEILFLPAFFLLSHNIMCIGDFALVNFVLLHGRKVITFDETKKKKSYFYEEFATK